MSRYRKVLSRIWMDDKFPFLSTEGRLLFLYHLTSERSTPFLLYVEGPGAMGDALRMPSGSLSEGMSELSEKSMVWYADDGSNLVFLPNALRIKENAPESPNAVKAWVSLFDDLPKTPFLSKCLRHWSCLTEGIEHALTLAFLKALPLPNPIQEQEQEQDIRLPVSPKRIRSSSSSSNGKEDGNFAAEVTTIISRINELSGKAYEIDSKEVNKGLVSRLKEGVSVDECLLVVNDRWADWKNTEMTKHFNPETLFRPTKFAKYRVEAKANGRRSTTTPDQELPPI